MNAQLEVKTTLTDFKYKSLTQIELFSSYFNLFYEYYKVQRPVRVNFPHCFRLQTCIIR